MGKSIKILVGTMTGTAELVAEEVQDALAAKGWDAEMILMDGLDAGVFDPDNLYLICSSTYGQGDVPDNAQTFMDSLKDNKPDLTGIRYGVIALGDQTYAQTFCFGGKTFDKVLGELGAERIGEPMLHNASGGTMPEDDALEWIESWQEEAGTHLDRAA